MNGRFSMVNVPIWYANGILRSEKPAPDKKRRIKFRKFFATLKSLNNQNLLGIQFVYKTKMTKRHIYIIRVINTNFYKIGISNNIKKRISDLQTASPFELTLIYKKPFKDFFLVESFVQNSFEKKHIRGEWFELNIYDVNSLISFLENLNNVEKISNEINSRLALTKKHHANDIKKFRQKVYFKDISLHPTNYNLNSRWHISYYAKMTMDESFTRFRVYGGLNRIKNKTERILASEDLKLHIIRALEAGYNPFNDDSNILNFSP